MTAVAQSPTLHTIPISELHESPWNPRRHYDAEALTELGESLRRGQMTPCLVRPRVNGGYELAAGHRRRRAAEQAGLTSLLCLVRELEDAEFLELLILENGQREDVHPLDEAFAYERLLAMPGYDVAGVAAKFGKSASYVYGRLHLVHLIPEAQEEFFEGRFPVSHALLISRLAPEAQPQALKDVCLPYNLVVRPLEDFRALLERNFHISLSGAPWKLDDAELVPAAGACLTCPQRTGTLPDLFADVRGKNVCTNRSCHAAKTTAFVARALARATEKGQELVPISRTYSQRPPKDGKPVPVNMWTEVKASTKGAVKAIDVETGKSKFVKVSIPKPTKKREAGRPVEAKASRADAEREQRVRTAMLRKIIEASPEACPPAILREFVAGALGASTLTTMWFDEMDNDLIRTVLGWPDASGGWLEVRDDWKKRIQDEGPTTRLMVAVLGSPDIDTGAEHPALAFLAEVVGVDLDAIRQAFDAEEHDTAMALAQKSRAQFAAAQAATKKSKTAKPTKKSKAEPFDPDQHPCESCGCTLDDPCAEGCSWDPKFLKMNRAVCSQCAALVRKREASA